SVLLDPSGDEGMSVTVGGDCGADLRLGRPVGRSLDAFEARAKRAGFPRLAAFGAKNGTLRILRHQLLGKRYEVVWDVEDSVLAKVGQLEASSFFWRGLDDECLLILVPLRRLRAVHLRGPCACPVEELKQIVEVFLAAPLCLLKKQFMFGVEDYQPALRWSSSVPLLTFGLPLAIEGATTDEPSLFGGPGEGSFEDVPGQLDGRVLPFNLPIDRLMTSRLSHLGQPVGDVLWSQIANLHGPAFLVEWFDDCTAHLQGVLSHLLVFNLVLQVAQVGIEDCPDRVPVSGHLDLASLHLGLKFFLGLLFGRFLRASRQPEPLAVEGGKPSILRCVVAWSFSSACHAESSSGVWNNRTGFIVAFRTDSVPAQFSTFSTGWKIQCSDEENDNLRYVLDEYRHGEEGADHALPG